MSQQERIAPTVAILVLSAFLLSGFVIGFLVGQRSPCCECVSSVKRVP